MTWTGNRTNGIKDGIRDADAGRTVPHDQVVAEVDALIETARKT